LHVILTARIKESSVRIIAALQKRFLRFPV
jgi:hypothetical protein